MSQRFTIPGRLGPYFVEGEIARGAMGVVYRAADTRLGRPVALKALPYDLVASAESLARIEREAKTLAALNHPNVATIHSFEEHQGIRFLVLELVEGETLAERLLRGALPLEEALSICRQIAEGLIAAHDRAIIHRDLKPANVKITPEDRVKVLDFGLALRVVADSGPASPTASTQVLELPPDDEIAGTLLYMSPEQARGSSLDSRSDVWAFGCVLFECLTGKAAFDRPTSNATLTAVLVEEPRWELLPSDTPPGLRAILARCLEKTPTRRPGGLRAAREEMDLILLRRQHPEIGLPADRRPSHNLPTPLSSFIGRVREKSEVKDLVRRSRLLTLTGTGGCGKTRLALEVARELLPAYVQGVWWVELDHCSDPALLPQSVAAVLGLKEEPGSSWSSRLADFLEGKKSLLLVLDNCEHLLSACADLSNSLLQCCPGLSILATSREGLGVRGETTYTVSSLSFPDPRKTRALEELSSHDAVNLFVERARALLPSFQLEKDNALFVAQICQRLDGIPLAIELAAARARVLSVEQISKRLSDSFRLLTGGGRTALPRHQTLRAAIGWSYDLLSREEQALFRRLSVFAGGWSLEAVEAVCASSEGGDQEVLELLTRLVDKSLVAVERDGQQARYRLLETVRQFSRDHLLESGEGAAIRGRHRRYYLELAKETAPKLAGPEQAAALACLHREHDNLRAALEWCEAAGEAEVGLEMSVALSGYWALSGHHEEGRTWIERGLAAAGEACRPGLRAHALSRAGQFASRVDDYAAACTFLIQGITLSRELGDGESLALSLQYLGLVSEAQGDYAAAMRFLEEAVAISRERHDRRGLAACLQCLGSVAMNQGDYTRARALKQESLSLNRELAYKIGIAASLNQLGVLALAQGDYPAAHSALREGLALHRELGFRHGMARALTGLGHLAQAQGDYLRARKLLEESLGHDRDLGNRHGVTENLNTLGRLALAEGDIVSTRALLTESLTICRQLGYRQGIAASLNNQGKLSLAEEDYAAARSQLEASLALYRELGHKGGVAFSLLYLALVDLVLDRFESVREALRESLFLHRALDHRHGIAASLEAFAALAGKEGNLPRAARLFGAAEAQRAAIGARLDHHQEEEHRQKVTRLKDALGEEPFAAAWSEGRVLGSDKAIALALEENGA